MGGFCTTTTTTTTTDSTGGTTTTPVTTVTPIGEFCAKNPGSPLCAAVGGGGGGSGTGEEDDTPPSTFSGTCSATSCTGDAIQCAMAQEQKRRMCELMDTQTPLSQKGLNATTAGDQPGDHPGAPANRGSGVIDFGSSIDQSNPWGDGCLADQTIPINVLGVNQSVVIPWGSTLCEPMVWMGRIAVALTMILCARLLIRSV